MSLGLGRFSAARDDSDDDDATEVNDATAESDANRAPDEEAADEAPRRSVLAPFMTGSSADDTDGDGDTDGDTGEDEAAQRGAAVSRTASDADSVPAAAPEDDEIPAPSSRDVTDDADVDPVDPVDATAPATDRTDSAAGVTDDADVDPVDATAPATDRTDSATGGGEDLAASPTDEVEAADTPDDDGTTAAWPDEDDGTTAAWPDDDDDTTAAPLDDEETAATSDAGGPIGSSFPGQGGRSPSEGIGVDSPLAAAGAASGIPDPRSATFSPAGATEPRLDSSGLGRASVDVDGPLLEDAEELRTNWLRLQAGFVDDPHEAVSDAADLVEHAAQAFVGALRMRQQRLRDMWDGSSPSGTGSTDTDQGGQDGGPAGVDTTEQLRQLMRHYRALFNHICKS
jgi:hypothetical protein